MCPKRLGSISTIESEASIGADSIGADSIGVDSIGADSIGADVAEQS